MTGGGLLRWQVKSGSSMRFLEEARRVIYMSYSSLIIVFICVCSGDLSD